MGVISGGTCSTLNQLPDPVIPTNTHTHIYCININLNATLQNVPATDVYKGQASLLVHTQADSYPHPTKTSSHRTNPTGSRADKLKIPACVGDYNWRTTTLLKADSNTQNRLSV